ncbi:Dehydration-responsive element-binding protein 1F [Dichanthelium oligosanthes]|uniref:Dehydration-responsive element-binding protein 1F n=1 Tax=Dichanthelium oligosanthes TaxID=888268 RepID=A0A1E5UPN7_9POAL|nr:Dehydration-responsive element-binding protein 1F [Dichanthelium oligosanthes]
MADAEDYSSASSSSLSPPTSPGHQLPPKRRAGRKKFRETRHPLYRGVRARAGGTRWVCEVREPQAQARIWLGTYPTPEMAARAHDVAAIALRGARAADLNFPDSPHTLPRARTASPEDIRCAAAQGAELYRPSGGSIHHQEIVLTTTAAPPPPPPPEPSAWPGTTTTAFLDEDAIFDMPGLIDDMARGMMLTPPAMGKGLADWSAVDDYDHTHADCTPLWMDY